MRKITGLLIGAMLISGVGTNNFSFKQAVSTQKYCITQEYGEEIEDVTVATSERLQINAKAAYLMDFGTQTPIFSQNDNKRLPIASMCKIMTLLLAFDALDNGVLRMDEEISVSETAASMGGSQVFLEANAKYQVRELLKSIVVCSANDSCVALAEKIAGNEALFVDRMNEKAKEIGATDTLFANCTGLPKEPQYSCAKDVAIMLKNLLKHEEYYEFGQIWMDKFQHPEGRYTEITNTNKLVRFYDGCDGGKTGFTNEAGFCLAATAERNGMRIISVVIGEADSNTRFNDVRAMFDYAFANYCVTPIVQADTPLSQVAEVNGGKNKELAIYPERTAYAFNRRGEKSNITTEINLTTVKAPIKQSDIVGEIIIFKDGVETERMNVLAGADVEKAGVWDRIKDIALKWTSR